MKLKVNPKWKVGVVTARFNQQVTEKLRAGAFEELKNQDFSESQIVGIWVPGAYEIPLGAKWLFEYQKCDAVIALGAVIRGETTHYDYVCSAAERGCTQLQLEEKKPVVFGVLTTEDESQAFNRTGGEHGHKGVEAVHTMIEMLNLKKCLKMPDQKENENG